MARARAALALLAALLVQGCPRFAPPAAPLPLAMVPSQGTGVAPLAVAISGEHFHAAGQTDFVEGKATLDAAFQARLLPDAGGGAVPLEAVRLTADRRLEATVPAGLARGGYSLEVIDPAGRAGVLAQAFRVVIAPETVASFRVVPEEPAFAGVPFLVTLTAVDGAGAVVDGFTGSVQLTASTGAVAPAAAGPFALGQLSLRVTPGAVEPAQRLTASDGLHAGTSAAFPVDPGPPVAVAVANAPATIAVGACSQAITVELRDGLGNATRAPSAIELALQSSPAGALEFHVGGGGCTAPVASVAVAAGASSATFRIRGAAAGPASIRIVPTGLPSATVALTLSP
jgi:hypothetical protein